MKVSKVLQSEREFVAVVQTTGSHVRRVSGITVYHMATQNYVTVDVEGESLHSARHLGETTLLEHLK